MRWEPDLPGDADWVTEQFAAAHAARVGHESLMMCPLCGARRWADSVKAGAEDVVCVCGESSMIEIPQMRKAGE
jgi:hypothetical protein